MSVCVINVSRNTYYYLPPSRTDMGFPGGPDDKESACKAGDPDSIPGSGRSPGEGMAIHPRILAWRIPWTEEPGELKFMELQRVRHDCVPNTFTELTTCKYKHQLPKAQK